MEYLLRGGAKLEVRMDFYAELSDEVLQEHKLDAFLIHMVLYGEVIRRVLYVNDVEQDVVGKDCVAHHHLIHLDFARRPVGTEHIVFQVNVVRHSVEVTELADELLNVYQSLYLPFKRYLYCGAAPK